MKARLVFAAVLLAVIAGLIGKRYLVGTQPRRVPASEPQTAETQAGIKTESTEVNSAPPPGTARTTDWSSVKDPAIAAKLAELLNEKLSLKERAKAAQALANTEQGIAALKVALQNGKSRLKAVIAEELGESSRPEAKAMLQEMIQGEDETAARGAIRGLAVQGDAEAARVLDAVLFDETKPLSVRTEAALGLGNVRQPEAARSLERAANEIQDETIRENVLEGL